MSRPARVLQVYNQYRRYGGEDTVVYLEAEMLRRQGHQVELLRASTRELNQAGPFRLATAGLGAVWSFRGYAAMKSAIAAYSPDIVHVHNEFPLLSPSIFWACSRAGVPVVHTMHNYRFHRWLGNSRTAHRCCASQTPAASPRRKIRSCSQKRSPTFMSKVIHTGDSSSVTARKRTRLKTLPAASRILSSL